MAVSCRHPPFEQGKGEVEEGGNQDEVVEFADIKKYIPDAVHDERHRGAVDGDKFFRLHKGLVPVAVKGEAIPNQEKKQRGVEFKPTFTTCFGTVNAFVENYYAGKKKDMSYLMNNEPLRSAMLLKGKSGSGNADEKEGRNRQ